MTLQLGHLWEAQTKHSLTGLKWVSIQPLFFPPSTVSGGLQSECFSRTARQTSPVTFTVLPSSGCCSLAPSQPVSSKHDSDVVSETPQHIAEKRRLPPEPLPQGCKWLGLLQLRTLLGLPWWPRWRLRLDPWVGKIPWKRAWQPTLVFLPGEFHGQRSLAGYSPQNSKELDTFNIILLDFLFSI